MSANLKSPLHILRRVRRFVPAPPLIFLLITFALSRLIYYLIGVRFEIDELKTSWQAIDPALMRSDLLRSLFYLHTQPPLFNLFLGLVAKIFDNLGLGLHLAYLTIGVLLVVTLYQLLCEVAVGIWVRTVLVFLFVISPSCIFYETSPTYTYPLLLLVAAAALFLLRFGRSGLLWPALAFFSLVAAIILTRSLFHIVWFVAVIALVLLFQRRQWRKVLLAACVPFVLVLAVYVKNDLVFGQFTTSTWLGMNLARTSTFQLPTRVREKLADDGKISHMAFIKPFSAPNTYRNDVPFPPRQDVPVLDKVEKSTRAPNMNHLVFVEVSALYLKDALYVIQNYPDIYRQSVQNAFIISFLPPDSYINPAHPTRSHILGWDKLYSTIIYGQFDYIGLNVRENNTDLKHTAVFIVIGFFVSLVYCLWILVKFVRRRQIDPAVALLIAFALLTIVYVTVVGSAFEIGENFRFRYEIDPLFLVPVGLCLTHLSARIRSRWGRKAQM